MRRRLTTPLSSTSSQHVSAVPSVDQLVEQKPLVTSETSDVNHWSLSIASPLVQIHVFLSFCLNAVSQLYFSLVTSFIRMSLSLGRLWSSSSNVGKSAEAASEEEELRSRNGSTRGKKVKRRRKKDEHLGKDLYFPGMVNLSGTLCYMNSVLQAFASIGSLHDHLQKIIALAVEVDFPTPVTDALLEVLQDLNTPQLKPPPALRPHALLVALSPLPQIRRLLATREQQDAHELFVVLAEAVSDEAVKVAGEVAKLRGLGDILSLQGYVSGKAASGDSWTKVHWDAGAVKRRSRIRGVTQPWEGLMARRRVCKRCGYCEPVRMDTLSGMELAIPLRGDTTVDACIAQYLAPEHLEGVTCEMCSVRATLTHYSSEVQRLSSPPGAAGPNRSTVATSVTTSSGSFSALENLPLQETSQGGMTPSRKKRARDARKAEMRLREMVEAETVQGFGEPVLPSSPPSSDLAAPSSPIPVKWQTVHSDSLRHATISRPPRSLRLHFIRSEYTPYGAVLKKTARVAFPMILDLSRFVANGIFEERSDVRGMIAKSVADGREDRAGVVNSQLRTLYRLESVILHYGYTHSSGHFVCIRRIPRPQKAQHSESSQGNEEGTPHRPSSSRKACPDGCSCQECLYFGQVRGPPGEAGGVPGKGWLRISDADVDEVGEEELIQSRGAVFMCFYERVGEFIGPPRPSKVTMTGTRQNREVAGPWVPLIAEGQANSGSNLQEVD